MNVIFLTICRVGNIEEKDIYCDLMRKFKEEGHNIWVVYPRERRFHLETEAYEQIGIHMMGVKTLNIQKTNIVEKGIGTILIETQFKKAIKKYLRDVKFDLILYSTPPITFTNVVKYLKKENPQAISYLLLKDIFPQNAVDIGMFSKGSLFNLYFRHKEVGLYKSSDYIGCMSPANVKFVIDHNPYYPQDRVEVAPNSITLSSIREKLLVGKIAIRNKYNIPTDVPVFIYGGNLGKPQGIDFLIKCLDDNKDRKDCFFVVVGNGTEYDKLDEWYQKNKGSNVLLMQRLPKEDYDMLVRSCDIGMIFLDHRFTIPNYPSRLLDYLEYKMPIICATDKNTDIGAIAEENGYGYWCESKKVNDFRLLIDKYLTQPAKIKEMGMKGYDYLKANYTSENTYKAIIKHV